MDHGEGEWGEELRDCRWIGNASLEARFRLTIVYFVLTPFGTTVIRFRDRGVTCEV